jgi:hypothetical protein
MSDQPPDGTLLIEVFDILRASDPISPLAYNGCCNTDGVCRLRAMVPVALCYIQHSVSFWVNAVSIVSRLRR